MYSLKVTINGAGDISALTRARLEKIYLDFLTGTVTNVNLLKAIHDDDAAGTESEVEHFDIGGSAWRTLKGLAYEATVQIEPVPDLAYFEIDFIEV